MKNICKKIIIMFVMVLGIMGGYSINAFASDDFEIGVSNLNGTEQNSAHIGSILEYPEINWRRYDDTNNKIQYDNSVIYTTDNNFYGGSCNQIGRNGLNGVIKFKFSGTSFRIISIKVRSGFEANVSKDISIKVDGKEIDNITNVINDYDQYTYKYVLYESEKMDDSEHFVEIAVHDSLIFDFDAIDIEGELLPYEDNTEEPETPDDDETKKTGALLIINLVDGETKIYDVSSSECQKFLDWYDDNDKQTYKFKKEVNSSINIDEYVVHDKITHFEIRKY